MGSACLWVWVWACAGASSSRGPPSTKLEGSFRAHRSLWPAAGGGGVPRLLRPEWLAVSSQWSSCPAPVFSGLVFNAASRVFKHPNSSKSFSNKERHPAVAFPRLFLSLSLLQPLKGHLHRPCP